MSDIFREVDEDLRREQAKKIWRQYGGYIVGAAVLIVLATGGYRLWEYWQVRQAESTGDRFLQAMQLADDGKAAEAEAAFTAIATDGKGAYPVLARLRAASGKAATDPTGAASDFDAIAADTSVEPALRSVAQLRAAMLLVDTTDFASMKTRLEPLAATGQPFRNSAREILGLSAFRAGDYEQAKTYLTEIASDPQAPSGMVQRVSILLDLVRARQGDVPQPEKPPEG